MSFAKEKRSMTSHIKKMYKVYFDCYLGDQDKSWDSHVFCLTCVKALMFGVPMIWREQKKHSNDC